MSTFSLYRFNNTSRKCACVIQFVSTYRFKLLLRAFLKFIWFNDMLVSVCNIMQIFFLFTVYLKALFHEILVCINSFTRLCKESFKLVFWHFRKKKIFWNLTAIIPQNKTSLFDIHFLKIKKSTWSNEIKWSNVKDEMNEISFEKGKLRFSSFWHFSLELNSKKRKFFNYFFYLVQKSFLLFFFCLVAEVKH